VRCRGFCTTSNQTSLSFAEASCAAVCYIVSMHTQVFTTVCRMVLESPRFEDFFLMVEVPNFEIASDAFQTFKVRACAVCKVQSCRPITSRRYLTNPMHMYGSALVSAAQELMTRHKNLVAAFTYEHYNMVCHCRNFLQASLLQYLNLPVICRMQERMVWLIRLMPCADMFAMCSSSQRLSGASPLRATLPCCSQTTMSPGASP
jgi:Mo25-like